MCRSQSRQVILFTWWISMLFRSSRLNFPCARLFVCLSSSGIRFVEIKVGSYGPFFVLFFRSLLFFQAIRTRMAQIHLDVPAQPSGSNDGSWMMPWILYVALFPRDSVSRWSSTECWCCSSLLWFVRETRAQLGVWFCLNKLQVVKKKKMCLRV